jgi:hypothetical protein
MVGAPNAAPEWQAGSLRWRSGELVVACPLEGPVGKSKQSSSYRMLAGLT